jgi:hypothetical protein
MKEYIIPIRPDGTKGEKIWSEQDPVLRKLELIKESNAIWKPLEKTNYDVKALNHKEMTPKEKSKFIKKVKKDLDWLGIKCQNQ